MHANLLTCLRVFVLVSVRVRICVCVHVIVYVCTSILSVYESACVCARGFICTPSAPAAGVADAAAARNEQACCPLAVAQPAAAAAAEAPAEVPDPASASAAAAVRVPFAAAAYALAVLPQTGC